jgi:hypothetical protein
MIEETVQASAALRAAQQLRDMTLRLGAEANDISLSTNGTSATLIGVRSAGTRSEFGDSRRPALRRLGRALESLRRGERL